MPAADVLRAQRRLSAVRPPCLPDDHRGAGAADHHRSRHHRPDLLAQVIVAKANDHEPHGWLTDVLTRLPTTLDRDIDSLLPHLWQLDA